MREALAPVLRDVAASGLEAPGFVVDDWLSDPAYATMTIVTKDSGMGFSVLREASPAERIASAADQVQEFVIEFQLWGTAPTNWPPCPRHPHSHPLTPEAVRDTATWLCPTDRAFIAEVGALGPRRRQAEASR